MKLPDIEELIRYPGAPQAAVILLALAGLCFIAWVEPAPITIAPCGEEQLVKDMPTIKDYSEPSWQWPIAEVEEDDPEPVAHDEGETPRRHRRRHWRR